MRKFCSCTTPSGFSLIELLIVVSIIGILAAIVSANYIFSIERAHAAACQQNLKTIHQSLLSYRVDYGQFPLADCMADTQPRSDVTAWGCGPAANGYWCGVPLILAEQGYAPENALFCPALKHQHKHSIEAYSGCGGSSFAGKDVPGWRFFRYAYNSAAADTGGYDGGQHNIEDDWAPDVWLARCAHVDVGEFFPDRDFTFPHRFDIEDEGEVTAWYGEFDLSIHGSIRQRSVQLKKF